MKIVQVLLARGLFSKRIPKKPLVKLNGFPLVEYTLNFMSLLPYEAYCYTDLQEVKNIAKRYMIFARDKLFEDPNGKHRTSEELIEYNKEFKADVIILFQLTSPIRNIDFVKNCIEDFIKSDYDIGFAVFPFNKYVYDEHANILNCEDRNYNKKLNQFTETGSFYIFRIGQIYKDTIFNGKRKLYVDEFDYDIDTYEDLERVECYLQGANCEN